MSQLSAPTARPPTSTMPTRRPRRGDWSRRLPTLDSPISSDSDLYPCDSSCSGDSSSSSHDNSRSHTHLDPHSPPRLDHHPIRSAVQIRNISLTDYAAAELPEFAVFLRSMIPTYGPSPHTNTPPPSSIPRPKSLPPSCFRNSLRQTKQQHTPSRKLPPTFPDAVKPSQPQVQFAPMDEIVPIESYTSSPRKHVIKRYRRAASPTNPRPNVRVETTRRYPDDIISCRQHAIRSDPDSLERFLLMERLWMLYSDVVRARKSSAPLSP